MKKRIYNVILVLTAFIFAAYVVWRINATLPVGGGALAMTAAIVFLVSEIFAGLFIILQLGVISKEGKDEDDFRFDKCDETDFPEIDLYVLDGKGDRQRVSDTINACRLVDYPAKDKVHIIPVTGGMDELNDEISKSKNPLFAVIDAGMFPKHEFLIETVSRFISDKTNKTGFVQSAVGFFNEDSYQFRLFSPNNVPSEVTLFQECQMPVYNNDNSVICVGTGTVFSREAYEELGGFSSKKCHGFMSYGVEITKNGYKGIYINKKLVSAFFDCEISGSITKHRSKFAEAVDAVKRNVLFSGKISLKQKSDYISYMAAISHPVRSIVSMLVPAAYCIFGIEFIKTNPKILLIIWVLIYIGFDISIKGLSRNVTTLKWRRIYSYSMAPFSFISGAKALFGAYKAPDMKKVGANKLADIKYFLPHFILLVLNIVAAVFGIRYFFVQGNLFGLLFAFWACNNIYFELMSVFWVLGRPYIRQEFRIFSDVDYELKDSVQTITGKTRDMSSRGVSIWCDKPYDIDDSETINIKLSSGRYQAYMDGKVIGVENEDGKWKYVIIFNNMEHHKQQYYGLLYDRVFSEVSEISKTQQGVISDIRRNIGSRFKHNAYEYRKMVRIPINCDIKTNDGGSLFVKNYNYKFILVHSETKPQEYVTFKPVEGLEFKCERIHKFGNHVYQYRIENYSELRENSKTRKLISEWIQKFYL